MSPVLLVDIDGVVIFEAERQEPASSQIFFLHKNLDRSLLKWRQTMFFVTHRSRREARRILQLAGIRPSLYVKLIAAEDLFQAAVDAGQIREAIKRGLLKSFALPLIERVSWQKRDKVVMLDDRQHNLDAMLDAGVGLALKAPIGIDGDHKVITSFDLRHTLDSLSDWYRNRADCRQIELAPASAAIQDWQRSGTTTTKLQKHPFNTIRRTISSVRRGTFFRAAPRASRPET